MKIAFFLGIYSYFNLLWFIVEFFPFIRYNKIGFIQGGVVNEKILQVR